MSNVGQALQVTSAFVEKNPGEKVASDTFLFAILNLTANMVNIFFGGQKEKDPCRLRYIKQNVNQLLAADLPSGTPLPDINENHYEIRKGPQPPPTPAQKFNTFMRKNSVRFGEIGLRFLGSIALVVPIKKSHWAGVGAVYRNQGLFKAFLASFNTKDPVNLSAGITYLAGKTIALFSKVPDPYNPRPLSALDRIREKYFFRTSSVVETGAASIVAFGKFAQHKPIGGAGGTAFMTGLTTRFFAPFGTREVDVDEVFAYTSDFLARAPREELPRLVTETSALLNRDLSDHLRLTYGRIYTRLIDELYRYHNIVLGDGMAMRANPATDVPLQLPTVHAKEVPSQAAGGKQAFTDTSSQKIFRGSSLSALRFLEQTPQETGIRR